MRLRSQKKISVRPASRGTSRARADNAKRKSPRGSPPKPGDGAPLRYESMSFRQLQTECKKIKRHLKCTQKCGGKGVNKEALVRFLTADRPRDAGMQKADPQEIRLLLKAPAKELAKELKQKKHVLDRARAFGRFVLEWTARLAGASREVGTSVKDCVVHMLTHWPVASVLLTLVVAFLMDVRGIKTALTETASTVRASAVQAQTSGAQDAIVGTALIAASSMVPSGGAEKYAALVMPLAQVLLQSGTHRAITASAFSGVPVSESVFKMATNAWNSVGTVCTGMLTVIRDLGGGAIGYASSVPGMLTKLARFATHRIGSAAAAIAGNISTPLGGQKRDLPALEHHASAADASIQAAAAQGEQAAARKRNRKRGQVSKRGLWDIWEWIQRVPSAGPRAFPAHW